MDVSFLMEQYKNGIVLDVTVLFSLLILPVNFLEYWIELITIECLCIKFIFSTMIRALQLIVFAAFGAVDSS